MYAIANASLVGRGPVKMSSSVRLIGRVTFGRWKGKDNVGSLKAFTSR